MASLKHLAYVFDAFIYYIRRGLPVEMGGGVVSSANSVGAAVVYAQHPDQPLIDVTMDFGGSSASNLTVPLSIVDLFPSMEDQGGQPSSEVAQPSLGGGRASGFFKRSNSTLFLGCPPPDPFSAPFHEALPLAGRPHLLTPNARRETLFGVPRPSSGEEASKLIGALPAQMSLTKRTVGGGVSS